MMGRGKLFIISGPSGAGKSTVLKEVLSRLDNVYFSISATTREPRQGEEHGREYYFIDFEKFELLIDRGELLEYARYADNYYGTPTGPILEKLEAGINVLLDIEVQGARQVKEKLPEAVAVFIVPPSMDVLEQRLRARRTDSEEKILSRVKIARTEYKQIDTYDYIVINDNIERAVEELASIVTAELCRADYRRHLIEE